QSAAPDEPTRLGPVAALRLGDSHGHGSDLALDHEIDRGIDDMTRPADEFPPRYLSAAPTTEPQMMGAFEDHHDSDEATRLSSIESITAMERARHHGSSNDERTRAVNIRSDPSISDVDWDLD